MDSPVDNSTIQRHSEEDEPCRVNDPTGRHDRRRRRPSQTGQRRPSQAAQRHELDSLLDQFPDSPYRAAKRAGTSQSPTGSRLPVVHTARSQAYVDVMGRKGLAYNNPNNTASLRLSTAERLKRGFSRSQEPTDGGVGDPAFSLPDRFNPLPPPSESSQGNTRHSQDTTGTLAVSESRPGSQRDSMLSVSLVPGLTADLGPSARDPQQYPQTHSQGMAVVTNTFRPDDPDTLNTEVASFCEQTGAEPVDEPPDSERNTRR